MLEKLAPRPGRHALLPELTAQQEVALLCRALHREGYDDHVAGHITVAQPDGTFLVNPWELAWDELTADDIIRVDGEGAVVEGDPVFYDEYAGTVDGASEAEAAAEALGDAKWAILKNHGVFVVAKDIRQAHLRAITLEHRCRLAWQVETLGEGQPITDPQALRVAQMSDDLGSPFLWEAMARREIRLDPKVLGEDGAWDKIPSAK